MTRREIPLDAAIILCTLAEHEVDYVVIGGLAVQAHGHPRTTQDLDLVPEPSAANLRRLRTALEAMGARPGSARWPTSSSTGSDRFRRCRRGLSASGQARGGTARSSSARTACL